MSFTTQNQLLLQNILQYFRKHNNINDVIPIINGESKLSIRIIDWFVTNYSKEKFTIYNLIKDNQQRVRFKVYIDYKLKLKSYSKKRFDPFCRWERISIPLSMFYNAENRTTTDENGDEIYIQTTIGQLNFFKWALENKIIDYINDHIQDVENDMNFRNHSVNNTLKNRKQKAPIYSTSTSTTSTNSNGHVSVNATQTQPVLKTQQTTGQNKTRKKREELSISAIKSIKKEDVEVVVKFH